MGGNSYFILRFIAHLDHSTMKWNRKISKKKGIKFEMKRYIKMNQHKTSNFHF